MKHHTKTLWALATLLWVICTNVHLRAGQCSHYITAGVRVSRILENYPSGVFPSSMYWIGAADSVSQRFPNSCPGAVWIVSLYQDHGVTEVEFPSSQSYPNITFTAGDSSELYLSAFDQIGAKIWLQVEPGAASVDTLIDLVLNRYQHHPCIAGFGIDAEWYKPDTHANGKSITDTEAERWEQRVKSHNPSYTLFLKHWLPSHMPPSYRGDILFVDDSQGFSALADMVAEFRDWAQTFNTNSVGFQIGYPADSTWWKLYSDPVKTIGDTLLGVIPNLTGLYWVDFTITKIDPVMPEYYVATSGDDGNPGTEIQPWRTIQKAFSSATPGSTTYIKRGVYNEKLTLNVSGSSSGGFVTFQGYLRDSVTIDGTGIVDDQIILIQDKQFVRISEFELRNNLNLTFGSGIWVKGHGDHIEIRNNRIHDMRAVPGGGDAMGISVYGSDPSYPISNIVIDGNHVYNCQPGHSESLTLNGNVDTFQVTNNLVHDNNNIGIDMIGGEGTCPTPSLDATRNGICRANTAYNCRSNYGGGYAAGVYVDGGRNIIVERNKIFQCDIGLEVGCENHGKTASGMIVRDNLIFNNDKGGLGFGGYNYPTTGRVTNSVFLNNTCYHNDTLGTGQGELYINYALACSVKNNIFHTTSQNRLLTTTIGNTGSNILDYNLWYTPGGINNSSVDYDGTVYDTFSAYVDATGQDQHSIFANPRFDSAFLPSPNLHLRSTSPAIDAGDPAFVPDSVELDFDGNPRVNGFRVDMGAYEMGTPQSAPSTPKLVGMIGNPNTPTLVWRTSSMATQYHLQVSTEMSFATTVVDDSALTDTSKQIDPLQDSTVFYWRVRARNSQGSSPWSGVWSFSSTLGNFSIAVSDGWNIVSIPVTTSHQWKDVLLPTAISGAFAYEGSYTKQETLSHGVGYWVKFRGNQIAAMSGALTTSDTIHVNEGWNLIGSISNPVSSSNIASMPGGLVCSPLYGYQRRYATSDTIFPGRGYWIKSNSSGWLVLSSTPSSTSGFIKIVPTTGLPPPPPDDDANIEYRTSDIPKEFALEQNYPNPFNPSTVIRYSLMVNGWTTLKVYDVLGREVATLVNEVKPPGEYTVQWSAVETLHATSLPSGVYFYRLTVTGINRSFHFVKTRKLQLIR